ncbi:MAG: HD-GYP domain-containing protein [Treponema sp.]|nr:HD-GYP domain-containing protein [Treponema sp.]
MKKISVDSLKEGMIFSQPVFIEGENILVPAGAAIRKRDLESLQLWGIGYVETDGVPIKPAPKPAEKPAAPAPKPETAKPPARKPDTNVISLAEVHDNTGVYRTYTDLIERLDQVISEISAGISIEARSIDSISGRLIQAVRDQRNSMIGYILGGEVSGYELAKSSVNSAILSALIATEMKLPNHKIMQIVTGALLHDMGMLRLPREIVTKKGGLSAAELQRMQAHPLYAYRIVTKELLYPEDVGIIVLQHHERWDGEGYPRKVLGITIDIGARIVSVADAFEAMVSQKPYRNSMMGYQAMKNLLSDNSRRFDPDVLKAFIQTMGIYPIGSIILLNNGALARVIEVQGTAPLRPRIRILIDEFGKAFKQDDGEIIDLLNDKHLFIARAVDPKEFAKKNA